MSKRKKNRDQDGIFSRPDSPYWWASYIDGSGRTTRRSTGIKRKEDPRGERAKAVRGEMALAAASIVCEQVNEAPASVHTYDEMMLLYLEGPSQEKRSKIRDRFSARQLHPFFSGRSLESLTRTDINQYIEKRKKDGVAAATINKELSLLGVALNWVRVELEWNIPNPAHGRKLKEAGPRERWLSNEEASALLAAASKCLKAPYLVDFIKLGLYTGMRPGEILGLEWKRIDLKEGLIYLTSGDQKNGKIGSVPLNREAQSAILTRQGFREKYCPDSPWVFCTKDGERIASIRKAFAAAVSKAGLKDVHPHDLRRTCGSWLAQAGVSIQAVSAVLRHSDIRITDRVYAHLAPATVRAAVAVLDEV